MLFHCISIQIYFFFSFFLSWSIQKLVWNVYSLHIFRLVVVDTTWPWNQNTHLCGCKQIKVNVFPFLFVFSNFRFCFFRMCAFKNRHDILPPRKDVKKKKQKRRIKKLPIFIRRFVKLIDIIRTTLETQTHTRSPWVSDKNEISLHTSDVICNTFDDILSLMKCKMDFIFVSFCCNSQHIIPVKTEITYNDTDFWKQFR